MQSGIQKVSDCSNGAGRQFTVSQGFAASPDAKLHSRQIVNGTRNKDIREMTKIANIGVAAFCSPSILARSKDFSFFLARY